MKKYNMLIKLQLHARAKQEVPVSCQTQDRTLYVIVTVTAFIPPNNTIIPNK